MSLFRVSEAGATLGIGSGMAPEAQVIPEGADALPTDPRQGYHLSAINVHGAWADYSGKGVIVGINDDGIHYDHPDLRDNYRHDLDFNILTYQPDAIATNGNSSHGTKVAGVIGAGANGFGTVGVAHGADITMVKGMGPGLGRTLEVSDVVNCSWMHRSTFGDNFKTNYASVNTLLEKYMAEGRDGLGSIVVFAGGNHRGSGDNANYHNHQNSPYTIAVSATGSNGHHTSWSNPGAALLVAAPGAGVQTTVGPSGYGGASGTSFSSPIVAAVTALMLEANPELGYRDVQEILAYSAQHNHAGSGGWQYNGAGTWNGGGLHFSHDYGFGLVDATAAVRLAETWTKQSTFHNLEKVTATVSPKIAIPDNDSKGIASTITLPSGLDIQTVQVDLEISHSHVGDLRVTLTSPDGTTAVLANRPGGSGNGQSNINFVFTANNFWGETGGGEWTLKVFDLGNTGKTGTLDKWSLILNGDAPADDKVYVYTDDFGAFTGSNEGDRRLLHDPDGRHTLNAATVTGDVVIDLNPGAVSQIAGNTLTISSDTVVVNAFLGDGNNTVLGNDHDNLFFGGRGNDYIDGGGGTNTARYLSGIEFYDIWNVDADSVSVTFSGPYGVDEGSDFLTNIDLFDFAGELYTLSQLQSIYGFNLAPEAGDDVAVTDKNTSVVIDVLANDSDPDGDPISVMGWTDPANGTVSLNPDGTLTYTPDLNFHGVDTFTYEIADGRGARSSATVTVTVDWVNSPPVAGDDTAATAPGQPVVIDLLANDHDLDGGTLSIIALGTPTNGSVKLNDDGTVTYTPNEGFTGTDTFSYTVSDGQGGEATANVEVSVKV
ncbi:MAG: tandem-95 repeat protein, partial [Rhodospirillales bacterium]